MAPGVDASGYTIFLRSCKHNQLIKTLTPSTQCLLVKYLGRLCKSLLTSDAYKSFQAELKILWLSHISS